MTDWAKLKVTDLKEECKARGIPLTGLKLKQQYIDKLEEDDAQKQNQVEDNDGHGEQTDFDGEAAPTAAPVASLDDAPDTNESHPNDGDETLETKQHRLNDSAGESAEEAPEPDTLDTTPAQPQQTHKLEASEAPEAISAASATVQDASLAPDPAVHTVQAESTEKMEKALAQHDIPPAPAAPATEDGSAEAKDPSPEVATRNPQPSLRSTPMPVAHVMSDTSTPSSSQINASELAEDQQRRRKRSATPVPSSEEMSRKRMRLSVDPEDATEEAPSGLETPKTDPESAGQQEPVVENRVPVESTEETNATANTQDVARHDQPTRPIPAASPLRSRSVSEERHVPPAVHPATSSLYMRNFKRPLHIPTLRSHIASVAASRSPEDSDPVTTFYLDNIRTHAFVTFTSIAAASRVRSAMHLTRFPDEPVREPLVVDYIPDDKVQSWIEQETGAGFGRGGGGRRFEVVYEKREQGVEAIFQEADTNKARAPTEPGRSSRMSVDRPRLDLAPSGVHPDRAGNLPPGDGDRWGSRQPPPPGARQPGPQGLMGQGFKALDELFDSTSAKPKLYFKPVPASIAKERLDMFRDLHPDYTQMGRSGDEGMKRYSFEQYKGRDEWVDKGPEFGFGKRGQDRLAGVRGRGGFRRGGDSWRGASTR